MIYLGLMEKQHHFHTAVQEGNFDGRMCAWEFFLPFYFSTNKHNYARYGSWYVHQMRNRDSLHSGNEIIFSVQSQARYNLRTAVDQREEQSLNKDRKTVDGVRRFSADNDAVTKWTMGRADQTWKLIPCCKCATLGNSAMSTNTQSLHRSCSQNHARQMLLQFWRMTMSTRLILC